MLLVINYLKPKAFIKSIDRKERLTFTMMLLLKPGTRKSGSIIIIKIPHKRRVTCFFFFTNLVTKFCFPLIPLGSVLISMK